MFQQIDFLEIIKKNRVPVLIASILALIVGVLCIISPYYAGGVLIWVMIALVGIAALVAIFKFIVPGKGNTRNGVSLAMGILLALCVVAIILIGVNAKSITVKGETFSGMEATTIRLLIIASIFFGVFAVVNNIFLLCTINNVPSEQRGWLIAKSILGIIVGTLMVIFPFVMYIVSVIIGGIYLIVSSITLIVLDIKFWKLGSKTN